MRLVCKKIDKHNAAHIGDYYSIVFSIKNTDERMKMHVINMIVAEPPIEFVEGRCYDLDFKESKDEG